MAGEAQGLYPLYTTQFTTAFELKLQQMGSKFRSHVSEGFHVGKMASPVNQIDAIQSKAPAGRFAPKNRTDATFTRRWVFPTDREIDQLIDSFDELKTIADPKSHYVANASNAAGRDWDDEILAATTRDAKIGQDASALTTETFSTANFQVSDSFGASASTGITVAKLIEAKRLFRHYHNDLENDALVIAIGSQQEADLLKQSQVVSTEYNDRPVLVDGKIVRFMGFDIVVSERVPQSTAGSIRGCVAWVKSGMYLGMWKETTNRVSIRNDLSGEPFDLYTAYSYGATRTQPGKVIQVLCADTTGADITP
jgi:Phage capsid protein